MCENVFYVGKLKFFFFKDESVYEQRINVESVKLVKEFMN